MCWAASGKRKTAASEPDGEDVEAAVSGAPGERVGGFAGEHDGVGFLWQRCAAVGGLAQGEAGGAVS